MDNRINFMVATRTGGVMEQPYYKYVNIQVIKATNRKEAEKIYNNRNNCSYFYGVVIGVDGRRTLFDEECISNSFC